MDPITETIRLYIAQHKEYLLPVQTQPSQTVSRSVHPVFSPKAIHSMRYLKDDDVIINTLIQ
ncbi:MAG TPA: hypothetical protein IAB26_08900 [Candidatus Limivivens merdigallinarum]|uniref:Uncharacterized protein n=1 Tax=Candidatus Limivivens merdigallinarum TaxID=2840859 RepID=A0A9D1D0N2_9FIRM|nr:hypothetical protein [Candidatus Limivivens merdigallinarum]